ncbi:MAG: hypothetical protein BroJett003_23280 [Planctomycetota bacterium]|nr:MAG: hypothetical protein BroJett003_23280 [Planctomycetota bacterium]
MSIVIFVLSLADTAKAQSAYLIGLGHLDPNSNVSHAFGVSADGSVVTGWSTRPNFQYEAFQWTREGGMIGMNHRTSEGAGVSGDGRVIVGQVTPPTEAFFWIPGSEYFRMGDLPGGSFNSKARAASETGAGVSSSTGAEATP